MARDITGFEKFFGRISADEVEPVVVARIELNTSPTLRYWLGTNERNAYAAAYRKDDGTDRYIPYGLSGWSPVGQELGVVDRVVSTGRVDLVLPLNDWTRRMFSAQAVFGAGVSLFIGTPDLATIAEFWPLVQGYSVHEASLGKASIKLECRDLRDPFRGGTAVNWTLPKNPVAMISEFLQRGPAPTNIAAALSFYPSADATDQTGSGGPDFSAGGEDNRSIGNFMAAFNRRTEPAATIGVNNRHAFLARIPGFKADETEEQDVRDISEELLQYCRGSIFIDPDTGRMAFSPLDLNRTPDFVLGPEDYRDWTQEHVYAEVYNRVRTKLYHPGEQDGRWPGPTFDDPVAADELGLKVDGVTTRYFRDLELDFPDGGFQRTTIDFAAYPGGWKGVGSGMDTSENDFNLEYPEMMGFSGSSQWNFDGITRRSFTGFQQPLPAYQLSVGRPGYWFFDELRPEIPGSVQAPEIVRVNDFTVPLTITGYGATGSYTRPNSLGTAQLNGETFSAYRFMIAQNVQRGQLGTLPQERRFTNGGGPRTGLWDITVPYRVSLPLITRHKEGVPQCSFSVPLALGLRMKVGNVVQINEPRFLRLGRPAGAGSANGPSVADHFEITKIDPGQGSYRISVAWLRGTADVTIPDLSADSDRPFVSREAAQTRPRDDAGGTDDRWEFSVDVEGSGETNENFSVNPLDEVNVIVDLSEYLQAGSNEKPVQLDLDVAIFYANQNAGQGVVGLRTARILRLTQSYLWSNSTGPWLLQLIDGTGSGAANQLRSTIFGQTDALALPAVHTVNVSNALNLTTLLFDSLSIKFNADGYTGVDRNTRYTYRIRVRGGA
jgi:hypothetical protein